MTAKLITFDAEARRALERGLDQVARRQESRLDPRAATWSFPRSGAGRRSPTTGSR
jgi:hypothetical protein